MPKKILSLIEINSIVAGKIIGNPETEIIGLNRLENVKSGELTFYSDKKYEVYLENCKASCLIVPKDFDIKLGDSTALIYVDDPYKSFVKILQYLYSKLPKKSNYIHHTAVIDKSAKINESAYIGPNCVVGANCIIHSNVILNANISLSDNIEIEENTVLHSGVVCYSDTKIGKNCTIHSGAVLGADGFGFLEHKDGSYEKIPQIGNVVIEDNVEIGANSTVDRAMIGSTIIKNGVKIDNLCQIGHNVEIGENTAIVSQTGISGSTKIGKRNRLGGQVGISGHLKIVDDVMILAQSGVAKSVEKKGIYFGSPIKERLKSFKIEAALNQLPQMLRDLEKLKRKIND